MAKAQRRTDPPRVQHVLFLGFLLLLPVAALVAISALGPSRGALLGFDLAACLFLAATTIRMSRSTPETLRRTAAANDAGRAVMLLIAAILSIVILVAVAIELSQRQRPNAAELMLIAGTLMVAWLFANLVYALHYTHMFYDRAADGEDKGGLDFPGTDAPIFSDFCYFAFVLGMTFQVSDVQISSTALRRVAVLHGLLAFLFNIGVLALSVNVIASAR